MAVPCCFLTLQRSGRERERERWLYSAARPSAAVPKKKKKKKRNRRRNTKNPRDVYCRIASWQNETTCSDTEKTDWSLMWTSEIQQSWRLVIFHRCDYRCSFPQILQTNLFVGHRRYTSQVHCRRNCSAGTKKLTHNFKKKRKKKSTRPHPLNITQTLHLQTLKASLTSNQSVIKPNSPKSCFRADKKTCPAL